MSARVEMVTSFLKGLHVLRSFGKEHRRQTITDVSLRTGMTRAAARRFLHTLCEYGYARSDGKNFELTPAVLELSEAYLSGVSELDAIREILHDITGDLGESASAGMMDGTDVVYLARSPARHRLMTIGLNIGTRLPAHATSMGQAILSQLSFNELEAFFAKSQLQALTNLTLVTKPAVKSRLVEVQQKGYALVSEELEMGLRSIAVPVPGRPKNMRIAVNISASAARVSEAEMIEHFLPRLLRAARDIQLSGGG